MDEDVRLQQAIKAIDEMLILNIAQNLRFPFFDDPDKDANLEGTYRYTPSNVTAKWDSTLPKLSLVKLRRSADHIVFSMKREPFWSEDLIPAIQNHYTTKYGFREVKIGIKDTIVVVALFCDQSRSPSKETIEKVYGRVEENPLLAERDSMYVAFCDKRMEMLGVHSCDKCEKVDKAILYEGDHGLPLVWCFRLKTKAPLYIENLEELIRDTARSTYYDLCLSPVYYKGEYARAGTPLRTVYTFEGWTEEGVNGNRDRVAFVPFADTSPIGQNDRPMWLTREDGRMVCRFTIELPVGLGMKTLEPLAIVGFMRARLQAMDGCLNGTV